MVVDRNDFEIVPSGFIDSVHKQPPNPGGGQLIVIFAIHYRLLRLWKMWCKICGVQPVLHPIWLLTQVFCAADRQYALRQPVCGSSPKRKPLGESKEPAGDKQ